MGSIRGDAAGADRWRAARRALVEITARFTELLRSVRDPAAPAVGDWRVADVAAHVVVVCSLNGHTATDGAVPFLVPDGIDLAHSVNVDRIAQLNATAARTFTERRLDVLAADVATRVDRLLRDTADLDPDATWPWLGGARLTTTGLLCHTLNELIVHGHDIATAERRPWPIPPATAALVFEVFVLGLVAGDSGRLFTVDGPPPGRVRAEVRSRHHPPVRLLAEHGRLYPDHSRHPPDLHLWADPAALTLILWRRTGVARHILTGKLLVWGRRPWLAPRFLASARNP